MIALAATRYDDIAQVNPCLADQFRLFVVIEDGQLQLIIVRSIVNSESKLLVPENMSVADRGRRPTCPWRGLPLGSLATSDVGGGLLCFFSQSAGTVGVLLADCFAIGKVLCAVDNDNEGSNDRPIEAHVGKDAGGMGAVDEV